MLLILMFDALEQMLANLNTDTYSVYGNCNYLIS